jgi:hypothetical protein
MQGEQCKLFEFCLLAGGRRPAIVQTAFRHRDHAKHGGFRTKGMANVVAICFVALLNWEDKKMLTRRSLLGSLGKSLLAVGVIAAPLATIVVPSEVEAEQTPSPSPTMGAPLHRGGGARQHYRRKMAQGRRKRRAAWRTRRSH